MCNNTAGNYGSRQNSYPSSGMNVPPRFQATNPGQTLQTGMNYANQRAMQMPGFRPGGAGQYGRSGSMAWPMDMSGNPVSGMPPPEQQLSPMRPPGTRITGDILDFWYGPSGQTSQVNPAWQPSPAGMSSGMQNQRSASDTLAAAGIRTSPGDWAPSQNSHSFGPSLGGSPGGNQYTTGFWNPNQFAGLPSAQPMSPEQLAGMSRAPQTGGMHPYQPQAPQMPQQQGFTAVGSPPSAFGKDPSQQPLMSPMDKPMRAGMMNPMQQNYANVASFNPYLYR